MLVVVVVVMCWLKAMANRAGIDPSRHRSALEGRDRAIPYSPDGGLSRN